MPKKQLCYKYVYFVEQKRSCHKNVYVLFAVEATVPLYEYFVS